MFSDRDYKFFNLAKSAAFTSQHPKVRIGATVTLGKEILGVGVNSHNKSHPLQKHYNTYRGITESFCGHNIHAELDALLKAKNQQFDLTRAKLYVYRVMKDGKSIGICRPCSGCMEAIKDFGIKHIFYTTDVGFAYEYIER